MNWILASILMLVFSNIYYFVLKLGQNRGITVKPSMLANFSIPPVLYYFLGKSSGISFWISPSIFLQIVTAAFFFSYIGSAVSYIAMQKAPNAGYSVIITKSYGIFTSIAAIFLFGSSLSPVKFLAILFTLACTAVVTGVFEKKKSDVQTNYMWVILSFVSFFCFGFLRLTGKWIVGTDNIPQFAYQFWLLLIVAIISGIDLYIHRKSVHLKLDLPNVLILAGTGIFVTGFYGFLLAAEVSAPNIGYVGAINTASNAVFTVISAKFLGDKISLVRFLGVLGVTAGIILLVI